MSRIDSRPLFVLILAALAFMVVACSPAGEAATGNDGNVAPGDTSESVNVENASDAVKMVFTRTVTTVDSQDGSKSNEGEFLGIVEAMDGNVWTISGQQVTIGVGTEIKNDISAGSRVKVHTLPQADGTVLVREIELAQGDDDDDNGGSSASPAGEREFSGTVETMTGDTWTISGQQVVMTTTTEIKNTINVGDRVKVHALPQANGTLLVREIELARGDDDDDDDDGARGSTNPAGEQEFFGTVEAINGNLWTVSGRQITLGTGTEIKGSIGVGNRVKVHASPQADGTLLVREIELTGGDDDDDDGARGSTNPAGEQEFFGTVEAINGNLWTISGQQVTVGSGTEIKGSISAGSQVRVHVLPQADGTWLVREVELAQGDDDQDDDSGRDRDDDDDDRNDDGWDDNSGSNDDDHDADRDDNSGPGHDDDDDRDDNSGDNSNDDHDDDDDNSGPGSSNDDDDD